MAAPPRKGTPKPTNVAKQQAQVAKQGQPPGRVRIPVPPGQTRTRIPSHGPVAPVVAPPDPRTLVSEIIALRRRGEPWDVISLQVGLKVSECISLFDEAMNKHLTLQVDDYMRWELDHLQQVSVHLMGMLSADPPKTADSLAKLAETRMRLMSIGVTAITQNQLNVGINNLAPGGTHVANHLPPVLVAGGDEDEWIEALELAEQASQSGQLELERGPDAQQHHQHRSE
jgi:hypothetical protein